MRRYNIAYIFTPIAFGGAERVNLTFLKQVDRSRFSVTPVVLVRPWEPDNLAVRSLREERYRVYQVPVAKKHRSEGADPFRFLRCYRMIHAFLKSGSFDLVHTHGYFADIMTAPAARLIGIAHLATCHGFITTDTALRLYSLLDRIALRLAQKIIAVSEGIRQELVRSGIREARLVTIQNAVAGPSLQNGSRTSRTEKRALANAHEQDFLIGYAGRLSEEKGIFTLISACSLLRGAGLPVKALILGDGPQRRELEALTRRKKLEEHVFFAGFQEDIERWLPSLDVFVLPSLTEGTPMALLEAMACGVPVVASAVGGVPQVVGHGLTGLLVQPENPEATADAVHRLYRDEGLRNRIAAAAREEIQSKYGAGDWVRRIEAEYLHLLEKRGK